jgi:hypothetical protein
LPAAAAALWSENVFVELSFPASIATGGMYKALSR